MKVVYSWRCEMIPEPATPTSRGDLGACLDRIQHCLAFRSALMASSSSALPYAGPLLDAVALFERLSIPYALVDGVAAMYYGRARFTEDLDFVAATGHMDLLAANPQVMSELHFDPTCTWKLYHETGLEIDIWKDQHGDAIASRARDIQLAGRSVKIADPHDLVAMKLRAGRLQDDYDISEVLKHTPIDESQLRALVTAKEFAQFLVIKSRTG
jgi:hypothetical protein